VNTQANQRIQLTVCAVTARAKSARSAPAQPAPDAQRWADNEERRASTLDGGDNCSWGEEHSRRSPSITSTGGVMGVWARGKAERGAQGCSNSTNPSALSGLAMVALGTWVVQRHGQRAVAGVSCCGEAE